MQQTNDLIKELESKVEKLISKLAYLKEENEKLVNDKKDLNQQISNMHNDISKLNEQKEVLTMANSLKDDGNNAQSKKKIDELVGEIDRCLTILNK